MHITFLNQKGGVGKTTTSILIGGTLHSAGYSIAFDDRDEQGSLSWWNSEIGKIPTKAISENPDVILCDTPGRLDLNHISGQRTLEPILQTTDRLVIVTEKSPISIQATKPAVEFALKHIKPGAKVMILFNKVRTQTRIGKTMTLPPIDGVRVLTNYLPLAAPYENVQLDGMQAVSGQYKELVLKLALEILL